MPRIFLFIREADTAAAMAPGNRKQYREKGKTGYPSSGGFSGTSLSPRSESSLIVEELLMCADKDLRLERLTGRKARCRPAARLFTHPENMYSGYAIVLFGITAPFAFSPLTLFARTLVRSSSGPRMAVPMEKFAAALNDVAVPPSAASTVSINRLN